MKLNEYAKILFFNRRDDIGDFFVQLSSALLWMNLLEGRIDKRRHSFVRINYELSCSSSFLKMEITSEKYANNASDPQLAVSHRIAKTERRKIIKA